MHAKNSSSETAKKIYDSSLEEGEKFSSKGVHIYRTPYLWRDDSPCHAYADTPTENFIPTPKLNTNDTPKWKRVLGTVACFLIVAAIVFAFFAGVMSGNH